MTPYQQELLERLIHATEETARQMAQLIKAVERLGHVSPYVRVPGEAVLRPKIGDTVARQTP